MTRTLADQLVETLAGVRLRRHDGVQWLKGVATIVIARREGALDVDGLHTGMADPLQAGEALSRTVRGDWRERHMSF